jgi:hypothetical protein
MFNSNPREQSVQSGYMGNAGATDTSVAGTWARDPFRQGQQPEADQLWRRGMDNTPTGQRIRNLRDLMKSNPGAVFGPQAMGMPGMNIGNVGGMSAMMQPSTGTLDSFSRYAQAMAGMQNAGNASQQPEETRIDPLAGSQGPFNPFAVMQASARKAGFDKKTVS